TETFMVLYRKGGTPLICHDCTCNTAYGYTFDSSTTSDGKGACLSSTDCCDHTLYLEIGSDNTLHSTGIYYVSSNLYSNTNFEVEIKLADSDGGGTIVNV